MQQPFNSTHRSLPLNSRFSLNSEHRALEQIRASEIRRLRSERRSSLKANPLRRKSGAGAKTSGVKGVRPASASSATAAADTTTPIQRHPRCASDAASVVSSTPQPRPHSDHIPGVTDDRYVAAWRKRGPVTLLNVAAATTATAAELSAAESRSDDDDGGSSGIGGAMGGAVPRRTSSKPPNPKLQQTIQEVLSESSTDSTDEFLGSEKRKRLDSQTLSHHYYHDEKTSEKTNEQQPPSPQTYSPGQVSIRPRRSDHLRLDESGESETDRHHPLPVLSV